VQAVLANVFPLLSIVLLVFPMGIFMLATPPLLILKHDTPLDGRFIRGLFNLYYVAVMTVAIVGAIGNTLAGQRPEALAMGGLAVFVFGVRRWMISSMDTQREAIARGESMAVPRFRRLHIAGMILNVLQLGTVVWGMTRLAT
jgi:hypothetical protein